MLLATFLATLLAGLGAVVTVSAAEPPGLVVTETTTVTVDQTCPPRGLPCAQEAQRMTKLAYLRRRRNAHLTNLMRRTYWYPQQLEASCVIVTGRAHHGSCARADRIIRCESVGSVTRVPKATAKNPDSTASGYGQWLDSTWAGTVFGRAGVSVFNGFANVVAVVQWVYRGGAYVHWLASAGCWG